MADENRKEWDDWRKADEKRQVRKSVSELYDEGYEYFKQSDFRHAASLFRRGGELAEEQKDLDGQYENLYWEGHCWKELGKLKKALECLLRAEGLEGGRAWDRFYVLHEFFLVASNLPLPREKQEELLKKLAPYKGPGQIGGSRSMVLYVESMFQSDLGNLSAALDLAQEAFACRVEQGPCYDDNVYYRKLAASYRLNGSLSEAWKTLRDWRSYGSTMFASTKSRQYLMEASLLCTEGKLNASWDAIRRCQAEERYLHIYGDSTGTLTWYVRIAVDTGHLREAGTALLLLFRFRSSESLYNQYNCFYWFAYYYAALALQLRKGRASAGKYDDPETAASRASGWYARVERVGKELDGLLETDKKQKDLEKLRQKLLDAGIKKEELLA